jgi:hypothetical protein
VNFNVDGDTYFELKADNVLANNGITKLIRPHRNGKPVKLAYKENK